MNWFVLVGFMGAGKSTLGQELADKMNIDFVDTDCAIEDQHGMSIRSLFDQFGEKSFREIEANFIRSLNPNTPLVLAVGGGLPLFHNNMDFLNQHGYTIYLKHDTAALFDRLVDDKSKRPLLANLTPSELLSYIEKNVAIRSPFYEQSTLTLTGDQQQVSTIIQLLQEKN